MPNRALVVSADAEASEVLRPVLQSRSLEVEYCEDWQSAENRLRSSSFAVAIVDCENESAAKQWMAVVRAKDGDKPVLIVAMVDAHNEMHELFAQGANFLLFKPISAERAAESLQAALTLLPSERRNNERLHVAAQASISYATTADFPAPLLNLSQEGAALHSRDAMPGPCRVYFQFTLPGDPTVLRLSGDVVWQDAHGRVGVHFSHVPQTSRRALDNWLDRNRTPHEERVETAPPMLSRTGAHVDEAKLDPSERREQPRRSCRLGVNVHTPLGDILQHCTLTDISAGGCYVETTQPLPVGTHIIIELRTLNFRLRVRGRVQSKHPGYGMGIAFKPKTDDEREQVRQLLVYQESPEIEFAAETIERI